MDTVSGFRGDVFTTGINLIYSSFAVFFDMGQNIKKKNLATIMSGIRGKK